MINFAHGEIFMIGMFAGYFTADFLDEAGFLNANPLTSIVSFLLMMLVAAAASTLVALAVERVAYRPLRNSPRLVLLISAIGASFFLQYTIAGLVGSGIYRYPTSTSSRPGGAARLCRVLGLKWIEVVVIVSALVMMAVLYLFVMRTKIGPAIRAVAEDKETAALMGVDVDRAIVTTFAVGARAGRRRRRHVGTAGASRSLLRGFIPGLKAFTAAVLGGIGNIPGAMLGGFFLGLVEAIAHRARHRADGHRTQLKDVIAFGMLVLVLIFRPQGLLGASVSRGRAHERLRTVVQPPRHRRGLGSPGDRSSSSACCSRGQRYTSRWSASSVPSRSAMSSRTSSRWGRASCSLRRSWPAMPVPSRLPLES